MPGRITEEQLAVMRDCERRGFRVLDARTYFEKMDPQKPRLCQVIRTPFHYAVTPIVAVASTSRKDLNRTSDGYLNTGLVDLFAVSSNDPAYLTVEGFEDGVRAGRLRSLADLDPEGVMALSTSGGKRIGQRDAYGDTQRYASVCAEFSHMKTVDEYLEEAAVIQGMLGGAPPSEEDYWKGYVPSVIEELRKAAKSREPDGTRYRLLGRITTLREAMAWERQRGKPAGRRREKEPEPREEPRGIGLDK